MVKENLISLFSNQVITRKGHKTDYSNVDEVGKQESADWNISVVAVP